ncbi:MAG: DoxX family protein [Deltaproteobacteria bacterium]|nr:DoxX family protein [Deltaproteobacteria bacterium]
MENKKIIWLGRVISGLALIPFIPSVMMKFSSNPQTIEGMNKMGIPVSLITILAILELTSMLFYLIPQTAILGAILLTGYLGGAILTHLRIGEAVPIQVALGVLVWLGLYLREPRLRQLLPIRK